MKKHPKDPIKDYLKNIKINEQIMAAELRLIDENGENLGIKPKEEALKIAKDKGLDLIEIAPNINPPVAKIFSFDKFRYLQEKKLKKQKLAQKKSDLKQIRITLKSAKNDLETKAKKIRDFIEKGHKVEIILWLKGREKQNKEFAKEKLNEFLNILNIDYKIIMDQKFFGKGLTIQITKK